jgi:hypothetical protein
MRTQTEINAEITEVRAAIAKATNHAAYSQGDKQVTRTPLADLKRHLNSLQRELNEAVAAASGANNPGVITPSWA